MRVVYFGTPSWAIPALEALAESEHELVGIVTAADAPVRRSRKLQPTPVKAAALERDLGPILQPASLRPRAVREEILGLEADVFVVVAYGRILPGRLLDAPRHGAVNVHFSLLPRHRGASPVQHALLAGDRETGLCTMRMERGLDTGPVYRRWQTPIEALETTATLGARLAERSGALVLETLEELATGRARPEAQDDALASWAPPITRALGVLAWEEHAVRIADRVRALATWPRVRAQSARGVFQILLAEAVPLDEPCREAPGTVLGRAGTGVDVAAGEGSVLRLLRVQPAGRKEMDASAALAGRLFERGERLEAVEEPA